MIESIDLKDPDGKVKTKLLEYKQELLNHGISSTTLDGMFIAGGCIRSVILDEEVKDIDLFCYDEKILYRFKTELCGSNIETDNAVSFSINSNRYQLIKVQTASPWEVISEFDFIMNMNFFEFKNSTLYVENFICVLEKQLKINPKCRNKLGTLARLEKFLNRGYKIGPKIDLLRLGQQISQLEPVSKFSQLEKESKLYFSFEEYTDIDFVEKDAGAKFTAKYAGSAY